LSTKQSHSGEVSPGEVSIGKVSPDEISFGEVSIGEVSPDEISFGEVSLGEISSEGIEGASPLRHREQKSRAPREAGNEKDPALYRD
jgi:hypothetical protein